MLTSALRALVLGASTLAFACSSSGGPTAIEIPIDRIVLVASCGFLVENTTCSFRAQAFTAEDQLVDNAVLRWTSSNPGVATVEEQGTTGLVRARQAGQAQITVSNTTGSVSVAQRLNVIPENPK